MVLWIKDFIVLNLILFSWLASTRGGKNTEGREVWLVIQLFTMQAIKSCRCGAQCGAKAYVFANNFEDLIQVCCACRRHVTLLCHSLRKKKPQLHFSFVFPMTAPFNLTSSSLVVL